MNRKHFNAGSGNHGILDGFPEKQSPEFISIDFDSPQIDVEIAAVVEQAVQTDVER